MPQADKSNSGLLTVTATTFSRLAGVIFFLIAVMQLTRLAQGWTVIVNGVRVPLWVSGIACIAAFMLGYLGTTATPNGDAPSRPASSSQA
jgi:hypothetical protein